MDIPERDTSMAERRSRTFSSSEEWQQALQALNSPPQSRSISSRPEQVFHHAERYTLGNAVKDMARAFRERHMETSLKRLRASPALIFLKVWHTYGIWVGACVYFTISANLMLAWYIDWYRQSGTYRESRGASQIFHFDLAPFFAIFCRSWLLVCVVGDLLRFCYLLAKDAWEEDAFVTYRRVVCGDFQRDLQDEIEKKPLRSSQWSVEMLSSPGCRALDALLQISIYLALDVVPVACFLISYMAEESFENATVAASAGLSGGSCIHAFVFFLAMWVTDVVAKCRGFVAAYRGEARLAPCEYPGESLQNFQWAGEFGDRHLANLEAARCVSFVEDSLDGPPDRCVSPRSDGAGGGGVSLGNRSDPSPPSSAATSDVARRLGGSVHIASAGALDVQESSSSALPPRLDGLARPQRRETAGSIDTVAVADQLNLCIPMCVCFSGTLALCLPHLLWVTVVVVGWQARNWALVGAGVALMVVTVCRRQCASGGPPTGERPCFPGAGSWELWALQAWGEQYCGLHSEVQQLSTVTFAVVLLLQGILLATLGQWAGMLVCLGMVLVTFLRHRMAYRERPWGWLIGVLLGFAHGVVATVLNAGLGQRWGVMTFMFALAHQLGLSRHNPRGFNLARFTAVLLNGVLVIVVGVVVLSIATQNADSNWSAFCTEGDATCKYYEVPLYASNMSLPLECDRHFGYGKDGQHLLSVSDFALFSALAYESEAGAAGPATLPSQSQHSEFDPPIFSWMVHDHLVSMRQIWREKPLTGLGAGRGGRDPADSARTSTHSNLLVWSFGFGVVREQFACLVMDADPCVHPDRACDAFDARELSNIQSCHGSVCHGCHGCHGHHLPANSCAFEWIVKFQERVIRSGYPHLDALVAMLALSSSPECRSQSLTAALKQKRRGWSSGWTTDILAHCGTERADSIVDFLRVAHVQRIPIHSFHCIRAMSLCSQASFWRDALEIFWLFSKVSSLHLLAANSQLAALAEGSLWQLALLTLQEMQDASLRATTVTFSSAINACAKAAAWQRALQLGVDMARQSVSRNSIAYNAMMTSCAMSAKWAEALSLFAEMLSAGVARTSISYNAAITACERAADWKAALYLFGLCLRSGGADVISCSAAISSCEKAAQWRQALCLLEIWRTTYFEFWDPENSTIVFAIRGTNSMLDVLDDLNIWGPAAIMQAFSLAGPSLSSAVAESVALLSTVMYGESMQKQYFSNLLAHVRSRTTQLPDRRFYITGHSLGGGLAKLVAAKTHMQAVTFMAPGLGTTSYVVYREHLLEDLRHIALTIMPENDVVSRVDTQTGITVKTDCDGNPLHCHQLYPTICTLLQTCGSGRAGDAALALPCGACDNMPCPSAHLRPRKASP
ncbi:EMB2076 [Symbiodinium sp. CCMP2592]|nr:EMB2076 [Symbiodinium sp. CCMP2592]